MRHEHIAPRIGCRDDVCDAHVEGDGDLAYGTLAIAHGQTRLVPAFRILAWKRREEPVFKFADRLRSRHCLSPS